MEAIMSGLARALRRQRQSRVARPARFFDGDVVGCSFVTDRYDGRPSLMFLLDCTADRFERYREALAGATSIGIRSTDDCAAIDLFGPRRRAIGRLATTIQNGVAAMAIECIEETLGIIVIHMDPDADAVPPFYFPVSWDDVTREEFHGEIVEVGHGSHIVTTINVHDGTIYHHRFESKEEADAQLQRNVEADLPFAGANLD